MTEPTLPPDAPPPPPEPDPFANASPLPGLEALGRAVVDAYGNPSGSPANFEALAGKDAYRLPSDVSPDPPADVLAALTRPPSPPEV
jgi:hypothetical protein